MLNGLYPVLIIQLSVLQDTSFGNTIAKIPLVSNIPTVIDQPPIPIYLSRELTGFVIVKQSKTIDIETETQTLVNGAEPDVNQKGLQSSVKVELACRKDSIGAILLSTLIDVVYDKSSSKEYSITYINGATTIFRGLLQNFAVEDDSNSELLTVTFDLQKGTKNPKPGLGVQNTAKVAL